MDRGYSTGLRALDREINGGVPPGSIILFTAPPASQSEQFLYKFAQPRETLYSTTIREKQAVRDAIFRTPIDIEEPTIEAHKDSQMNEVKDAARRLEQESTLIVDTINPIECKDKTDYLYFLNDIQNELQNTQSVLVLHGLKGELKTDNRGITKQLSDIVFDLTQTIEGGDIVNRLSVLKYRGGSLPDEPMKINLTNGITIDTSRDIA